jgi:hypothetical protein
MRAFSLWTWQALEHKNQNSPCQLPQSDVWYDVTFRAVAWFHPLILLETKESIAAVELLPESACISFSAPSNEYLDDFIKYNNRHQNEGYSFYFLNLSYRTMERALKFHNEVRRDYPSCFVFAKKYYQYKIS